MSDINTTLEERSRYGDFQEHAELSQALKDEMRMAPSYEHLAPDQVEALEMIMHKIARILNGDVNYKDNWHDIAGYATLVDRRLD